MLIDIDADQDLTVLLLDASNNPAHPDALPTFEVFGATGRIGGGTAAYKKSGTVTGATAASPSVITSAGHGLATGMALNLASIGGVSGVTGNFTITVTGANTFSLNGSTGTGTYTSGGEWRVRGLYKLTLDSAIRAAMERGRTYHVVVYYQVSSQQRSTDLYLTVA